MARMIPPAIADGAAPGEKAAFAALRDAPGTDDWTVFHSLAIGRHVTQREGEADFVVMAPGLGLLVIEVKSHLRIQTDSTGRWKLGNDDWTERSPFAQASGEFHSIVRFLRQRSLDPIAFPTGYAVWFTAIAKQNIPPAIGWQEWAVLDAGDLAQPASAVRRVLSSVDRDTAAKSTGYKHVAGEPSAKRVERIRDALSPSFSAEIKPTELRRRREQELASFTADQVRTLDLISRVPRVLVEGPAGTGKTYIAAEAARRHATVGERVLVVMFNRLLEDHLQTALSGVDGVTATRLHAEMERVGGVTSPANGIADWYNTELPLAALEKVTESGFHPPYDYLIVDEAQDIASDINLDFLDAVLVGGLSNGRMLLLGDFSNQNIFRSGIDDGRETIEHRVPGIVPIDLDTNCRNRREIGEWAERASNRSGICKEFRRDAASGDAVEVRLFSSKDEEASMLDDVVRGLRAEGYGPKDVVILAPYRDSAARRATDQKITVSTLGSGIRDTSYIRWGTIHEFKGMEAPAVILTDISGTSERLPDLIYAGATRAQDRLVVLTSLEHLVSI
ncbi:nuclease-related domain-containing DEAD/DEAH box helicase [Microbacterium sp. C7(2022)]|uniref:nuclease-related domain-containing DEAD/DEAH box helicase n=1 Tax=Microbacterium sp. C7(2022) TaxID=2992759 RepID=UPI00237C4933|nr:NERD domain-containing protein [Microbacterium sp. C7(2022)]MDE0547431.1 NERD domain-containing protein [Microbacterium sp. C7(2022)]